MMVIAILNKMVINHVLLSFASYWLLTTLYLRNVNTGCIKVRNLKRQAKNTTKMGVLNPVEDPGQ